MPIAREVIRQGHYNYDKITGIIIVKKMEKAKRDNNQKNYDKSVDDIFD